MRTSIVMHAPRRIAVILKKAEMFINAIKYNKALAYYTRLMGHGNVLERHRIVTLDEKPGKNLMQHRQSVKREISIELMPGARGYVFKDYSDRNAETDYFAVAKIMFWRIFSKKPLFRIQEGFDRQNNYASSLRRVVRFGQETDDEKCTQIVERLMKFNLDQHQHFSGSNAKSESIEQHDSKSVLMAFKIGGTMKKV
jgi:hypothetical protein